MTSFFITFEGGEGAGKSSVIEMIEAKLVDHGYDVLVTREPGGIEIAEKIRDIILDPQYTAMDARTEALLYAAARRQHLVEKILPALKAGKMVLCDRFIDSSLAYQGYGRELGMDEVLAINQFAIQDQMPDLTLFLDIEPEKGLQRISLNKDRERNRLDLEAFHFHERVHDAYQMLLQQFPERIKWIDADQPPDDVARTAFDCILTHILSK
ncbi:MAG TPA: dTMP kinase [Bacillota bacterium]|nr:dTMP kinase [Bacillota bacterium]